jgi:hypothetical protein
VRFVSQCQGGSFTPPQETAPRTLVSLLSQIPSSYALTLGRAINIMP